MLISYQIPNSPVLIVYRSLRIGDHHRWLRGSRSRRSDTRLLPMNDIVRLVDQGRFTVWSA
jgi:hypothetical protein